MDAPVLPNPKSSTSAEVPAKKRGRKAEPPEPERVGKLSLGQQWIGKEVILYGRDVTYGPHAALPVLFRGRARAIHITLNGVKVILTLTNPKLSRAGRTRVIEVTS